MIFKLHYFLITAGRSAISILLGAFIQTYTDATPFEIGALFMAMPFSGLFVRPFICSLADRYQAHQKFMFWCLFATSVSYLPFVIIPLMGESFYGEYPRISWYILVVFKLIGNSTFGSVLSIGDSLAINYAKRIETDFGTYRIWGTVSWMLFGLIIGQINDIWFLPKYLPAFIILILSALLNMSLYWLWPKEYFLMISANSERNSQEDIKGEERTKLNQLTKSLMPKEVVVAHMKAKVLSLFTCSFFTSREAKVAQATIRKEKQELSYQKETRVISKKTSLRILFLLMKRDPRIVIYFLVFICGGFNEIALSFFFISLSEVCTPEVGCNYSSLGGLLQATMAIGETILFLNIRDLERIFGRVNIIGLAFFLMAGKFLFYGTIWNSVDPHYSLLSESMSSFVWAIFITFQVETAHMFANEVEYILFELIEQKVIPEDDDVEALKLSLSSTMQALMTNANEGLGFGFGALIYGTVIEKYSYETLWLGIGICSSFACFMTILVSIVDNVAGLDLGFDKKAAIQVRVNKEKVCS